MDYAELNDITKELSNIVFDEDTSVTAATVLDFIAEETATINSKISKRYRVPIDKEDSPKSFIILRRLTVAMVLRRVIPLVGRVKEEDKEKAGRTAVAAVTDINMIVSGDLPLTDAQNVPQGYIRAEFPETYFETGKDQW